MTNLRKLTALLLATAALSLAACGDKSSTQAGETKAAATAEVPKEVEDIVAQATETFEKMSNKMIKMAGRLDKSTQPATFIHEMTLLEVASDAPEVKMMKEKQEEATKQQMATMCSDPLAKILAKNKINYKIVTLAKDGKEITSFNLDLSKCQQ